ncbi:MAG: hypothetical protein KDI55_14450 [Anaerolineae bacterium]|nr:hypothetical protein [Anaerolineae bacterium]
MKRFAGIGLMLCILLVMVAPAAQADDPLVITPYYGGPEYWANTGQEVIIRAGWGACTPGLAQAFTHAALVSMEINLDGEHFLTVDQPAQEFWSRPELSDGPISACVMNTTSLWASEWRYSLGPLAAGVYSLHFDWTVAHPIPDGGDHDDNGIPDLFTPDSYHVESDITIVVN